MTIASLIVDVAANTAKLTKDVEEVHGKLDRITSIAGTVGKALTAAFTVTAIIGATKQVLDHAGALTDLSAKTGISTTGLQKFDLAFKQSGVSLETVSASVTKLANNIIGGDKSAVGALEKMGLSVTALKGMAPEQQFTVVADAIGKIPNPTERAYAAMQVFGKGGAQLLQALDGHLAETTEGFEDMGLIINEQTIVAADRFGDQLELLQGQMTAAVAQGIGPMLPSFSQLIDVLSRTNIVADVVSRTWSGLQVVFMATMSVVFSAGLAISTVVTNLLELASKVPVVGEKFKGMAASARETTTVLGAMQKSFHDQAEEAWAGVKGNTAHQAALGAVKSAAQTATAPMQGFGTATATVGREAEATAAKVDKLRASQLAQAREMERGSDMVVSFGFDPATIQRQFAQTFQPEAMWSLGAKVGQQVSKGIYSAFPAAVAANAPVIAQTGQSIGAQMSGAVSGAFKSIGPSILAAIQGGGNVTGAAGSAFGLSLSQNLFGQKSELGKHVSGGITKFFGQGGALSKMLGESINAFLPGVGALLGPLASKIGSFFKGLFGPSAQEMGGRNAAAEFKTQVESMLSDAQRLELGQNNVSGAMRQQVALHIAIRDAAKDRAIGEQQASDLVQRLWAAEKQGPEAVKSVIEQINQVLSTATPAAVETAGAAAVATVESVTAAGMSAAQQLNAALQRYGVSAFVSGGAGSAGSDERNDEWVAGQTLADFVRRNGISDITRFGESVTGAEAQAKAANEAANFIKDHPGLVEASQQAKRENDNAPRYLGFSTGTGGKFVDFGAGTNVTLHGRERVVTEAEGAREAAGFGAMVGELAEIRAALKMLPKQLTAAMQTAM